MSLMEEKLLVKILRANGWNVGGEDEGVKIREM